MFFPPYYPLNQYVKSALAFFLVMILLVPGLVSTSDNLMMVTSLLLCFDNPVAQPISLPHTASVTLHFYFATRTELLCCLQPKVQPFFIWHFEIGFRIKTNRLAGKSNLFLADPHTWDYSCISDVFPRFPWKFVGQSIKYSLPSSVYVVFISTLLEKSDDCVLPDL